jgi:sulfatase modifying factor 1
MSGRWRAAPRWVRVCLMVGLVPVLTHCDFFREGNEAGPSKPPPSKPLGSGGPPLGPPADRPEPRVGMAFIPPGALVVGTAPDRRPRRADRELPGHQVMLDGFYIDQFAFPNEEGAIPQTNVTREEASGLCIERGKRLCTELEWERACKGPDNRTYEYGETYRAESCHTGRPAQLRPSGFHVGCQSDFGVRDMHGGPFEWTTGEYGRGEKKGIAPLRGGNSVQGEVVGRCANVEPEDPEKRAGTVGFRCCAGEANTAAVELEVSHSPGLIPRLRFDLEIEKSLLAALPEEAQRTLAGAGETSSQRVWLWRPIANEEIHLIALCGRGKPSPLGPRCGLFLARVVPGKVQGLAWVSSGEWVPNLHRPGPHEMLWLIGGDKRGSFKRLLTYQNGDVNVGALSQGVPKSGKRKKK